MVIGTRGGGGGGEFDVKYKSVEVPPRGNVAFLSPARTKILFVDDGSNIKILSPGSGDVSLGNVTITLSETNIVKIRSHSQDTEYLNLFFLGTK